MYIGAAPACYTGETRLEHRAPATPEAPNRAHPRFVLDRYGKKSFYVSPSSLARKPWFPGRSLRRVSLARHASSVGAGLDSLFRF
jgi:hypothetical protein